MNVDQRHTRLTYAEDRECFKHERPYHILTTFQHHDVPLTNMIWKPAEQEEIITNIRGREQDFNLDDHGFSFHKTNTTFSDWDENRNVEIHYLPEVTKILEKFVKDVDEVFLFDWRRRSNKSSLHAIPVLDMNNPNDALVPAAQVHLDQSPSGVLKRVRLLMKDRADFLLQGRVQVINVWRPLAKVNDYPLALCAGTSAVYDDLIEVDLVRRNYVGCTMYSKYKPGYEWYYLEDQQPEEVCLFKNFDSDTTVKAQFCPHVSFHQDNRPPGITRDSIEVRALVFTYPH